MASHSRHTLPHHQLPSDDTEKQSSPRRLNFGLLSPNASFSSISSSASHSASSPNQQLHYAPRTPLRSVYQQQRPASPARHSPLFRLLQPPSPHSSQKSRPSSPTMALHQPAPRYLNPTSPVISPRQLATVPNTRPPSRSERLLRDTLSKDEIERTVANVPLPNSPPTHSSPKAHRRRHSHLPSSSTAAGYDFGGEDYNRGSNLFRTAMSNPRPPSPSSISNGGAAPLYAMYGGHAEHQRTRALSPVSNSRSGRSGVSPRRDMSPTPIHRRHDGSQQRPSPLPLDGTANGLHRHHTIHTSPPRGSGRESRHSPSVSRRPRTPDEGSPSRGQPMIMTPPGRVLRARLEKVLQSGKVVDGKDGHHRGRSQSGSRRSNEVMDEEGTWAFKGRDLAMKSAGSMSPLISSNSGSSLSQASSSHVYHNVPPSAIGMTRARSKTDPNPPKVPHRSAATSPHRSHTAPSGVNSPVIYSGGKAYTPYTGTTPPLVSDSSPPFGPSTPVGEEDGLLTPPPTPPCTSNAFVYNTSIRQDSYCPSPYKSTFPPTVNPYTSSRRGAPQDQRAKRLGSARRPANAPVGDRYSSRSSERHHTRGDDCDDERSSSCSSRSFPASDDFFNHLPVSPTADIPVPVSGDMRPQFNARKASAQCRAMEGYVSFANIEGLGMPPDDPSVDDAVECGKHERGRSIFAWDGFRKLLGGGHVENGHRVSPQQAPDGVVM